MLPEPVLLFYHSVLRLVWSSSLIAVTRNQTHVEEKTYQKISPLTVPWNAVKFSEIEISITAKEILSAPKIEHPLHMDVSKT